MTAIASAPGAPPIRARLGVSAIFFGNGFAIGAWAVAIPQIKALFGLSDGSLSIVLLLAAFGAMASMPFAGILTPRFGGTGKTLRVTTPMFAALFALIPISHFLSPAFVVVAVAAFAFGMFNSLMDIPMNAHATVVERAWGAPIMSSFHAAWSAGGLAGSAIGGWLIHQGADVFWQIGIEAAIALALAMPWTFLIGIGDKAATGQALAWPERRLLAFGAIAALAMMTEGSVTDWSAIYLKEHLNVAADVATIGFVGYASMMLAMRVFGDYVVRTLGRMRTLQVGAAIVALGVLLVVLTTNPWSVIVGFWLIGAGVANMVPTVFSASADVGVNASLGIAMTATVGYAGFLAGPPIIGGIAQLTSLRPAFLAVLIAAVAVAWLTRFGEKKAG
jgi:MFS family permease